MPHCHSWGKLRDKNKHTPFNESFNEFFKEVFLNNPAVKSHTGSTATSEMEALSSWEIPEFVFSMYAYMGAIIPLPLK